MKELYNLSIKELIEGIDENILEAKEARKKLVIELNQEKDINRKMIKKELIKKYDKNIFRYKIQKLEIEEMIKDHTFYGCKKTAQEGQVQEQSIILELENSIVKITSDSIICEVQSKNSHSAVEQKSNGIKVESH